MISQEELLHLFVAAVESHDVKVIDKCLELGINPNSFIIKIVDYCEDISTVKLCPYDPFDSGLRHIIKISEDRVGFYKDRGFKV